MWGCIGYAIYALLHSSKFPSLQTLTGICSNQKNREILPCLERVNAMFLTHLVGVYRQWRRYNQSLRELNQLGDRELADIGISRGDIPRIAWKNSEH
jgi:uncharacterized protein YjiS (DUF1127 family)